MRQFVKRSGTWDDLLGDAFFCVKRWWSNTVVTCLVLCFLGEGQAKEVVFGGFVKAFLVKWGWKGWWNWRTLEKFVRICIRIDTRLTGAIKVPKDETWSLLKWVFWLSGFFPQNSQVGPSLPSSRGPKEASLKTRAVHWWKAQLPWCFLPVCWKWTELFSTFAGKNLANLCKFI